MHLILMCDIFFFFIESSKFRMRVRTNYRFTYNSSMFYIIFMDSGTLMRRTAIYYVQLQDPYIYYSYMICLSVNEYVVQFFYHHDMATISLLFHIFERHHYLHSYSLLFGIGTVIQLFSSDFSVKFLFVSCKKHTC